MSKPQHPPQHTEDGLIGVEVAYAMPTRQTLLSVRVKPGCTALQAVVQSGIVDIWPQINPDDAKMGIFSRPLDGKQLPLPGEYSMREGDRVEIYRPLLLSPREARERRAQAKKTEREKEQQPEQEQQQKQE